MKISNSLLLGLLIANMLFSCSAGETSTAEDQSVPPPRAVQPVPTAEQLAWHEMEQNAFIHFTTNTFTDMEWGYGDESPRVFNPTELDANQWMKALKDAGFKGVILTAKHHDGFALWPSKNTEHSVKNSPYKEGKGDVVREVAEAAKKHGLKFGVYLSPWDRNRADYGKPSYIEYYRNQLKELFIQYGPVFEMWFDGANGGDGYYGGANETRTIDRSTYYDWPGTLAMVDSIQPQVLFFSDAGPDLRWVGNEKGIGGETNWNTISNDTVYAGMAGIEDLLQTGSPDGDNWIPAEVNTSIRPGWFYHAKEDTLVKSPEMLFEIYLNSVGRGSTLLLNIPPDKRGLIHENDVAALKAWRKMVEEEFKTNLAKGAKATANTHRGNSLAYAADKLTDGKKDTYWATDDEVTSGQLEVELGEVKPVKYVLLQEYILLGQRVKSFNVEIWKDGEWQQVASGTTIGYKRILQLDSVQTEKVRVNITDAKAAPLISNIAIY